MIRSSMFRMIVAVAAVAAVVAVVAVAGLWTNRPVSVDGLVPHRAVYTIKAGKLRGSIGFVGVSGAMSIVVEKTCDAWIVAQDLSMVLSTPSGKTSEQGLRFASWESLDGTHYRFNVENKVGDTVEELNGEAVLDRPGGEGTAVFSSPEGASVDLPSGSFFPMSHTEWILENARAGKRFLPHTVFDGTDSEGPSPAILFIIRPAPKPADSGNPLTAVSGWVIRLSYYGAWGRDAPPDYEVQAVQLDNGISPSLILDYQDFTAHMDAVKIQALPLPDCG